ncbi:MAG: hypothetical protein CMI31_06230 [Opitutae bacterium]|nr:hypothetical protein [Opitutae bacterium]|tara:strand:+ start:4330 stop:5151 length:822 start_codon:yes stop_codon:yes gene_type:complete
MIFGINQLRNIKLKLLAIYKAPYKYLNYYINRSYFNGLRNLYRGKRAFVIGNGPSLCFDDLDKLKDDLTIASNKIYLAFEHTCWRPTYYTVCDPLVWEKVKNKIPDSFDSVIIEDTPYLPCEPDSNIQIRTWRVKGLVQNPYQGTPGFSCNFNTGIFNGYSVTYINLQLAAHLGANPIYLIGCDHHYSGEEPLPANSEVVVKKDQVNHFIKGYREPGEVVYNAPLSDLTQAFANARAYADDNNLEILNATRGGHLEVFDRVHFDDLFDKSPSS